MKEVMAIAVSLSRQWTYKAKKEAVERAGSFDDLVEKSRKKIESLDLKTAENQFKKLQKAGGWLWIYGDPSYPKILAKIPDPPLVVYGIGQARIDEENTLALIGTRKPTPYGKRITFLLAKDLVREGLTLVSGLARGIDSIGHQISVESKAPTVGVLAHGLDMVYPPENKKLAEKIVANNGSLISEFPFGIKPLKNYFSQRNRIISGLSRGVLVIEAGEKSGTRLTVNHALEQSREVFAVPGPIDSEYSIYTNELIFTGANMTRMSSDVLSFYPDRIPLDIIHKKQQIFKPNKLQSQMLKFFNQDTAKSVEDFLSGANVEAKQVLQNLTELELHGKVIKQLGSMYILGPK